MTTLLVDGNNVLGDASFKGGRDLVVGEKFLQKLEMATVSRDWEVIVVFDGPTRFLPRETGPLVVRYAPPGQTADTVIERLVYQAADRSQVVVVTQDRAEADLVRGLGARVWTAQQLLEELDRASTESYGSASP